MKKKREYSVPIREQMVPWLFLLPSLLFVSIMVLIPMLDALRRSFFLAAGDRMKQKLCVPVGRQGRLIMRSGKAAA